MEEKVQSKPSILTVLVKCLWSGISSRGSTALKSFLRAFLTTWSGSISSDHKVGYCVGYVLVSAGMWHQLGVANMLHPPEGKITLDDWWGRYFLSQLTDKGALPSVRPEKSKMLPYRRVGRCLFKINNSSLHFFSLCTHFLISVLLLSHVCGAVKSVALDVCVTSTASCRGTW